MCAVVTGGAGPIGSHLIERLHQQGEAVASFEVRDPSALTAEAEYKLIDVRVIRVEIIPKIERIYNLSAVQTNPGRAECEYYDISVLGTLEARKFATEHDVRELISTSSISVYDPSKERLTEISPLRPVIS